MASAREVPQQNKKRLSQSRLILGWISLLERYSETQRKDFLKEEISEITLLTLSAREELVLIDVYNSIYRAIYDKAPEPGKSFENFVRSYNEVVETILTERADREAKAATAWPIIREFCGGIDLLEAIIGIAETVCLDKEVPNEDKLRQSIDRILNLVKKEDVDRLRKITTNDIKSKHIPQPIWCDKQDRLVEIFNECLEQWQARRSVVGPHTGAVESGRQSKVSALPSHYR